MMRHAVPLLILTSLAVALSGCTQVRGHQGYIMDPTLVSAVQPGIDNKQSVEASLGRPTFMGQFNDNDWYYYSRETRQYAFNSPSPKAQTVLHVQFDAAGNVVSAKQTGLELVSRINPTGDTTPTLGRERTFLQDIFGNIGAVGAPGTTAQGGNDPTQP